MKPNILFVLTDQQRRAAMGFWKKDEYKDSLTGLSDPVYTPNIDNLADEGIVVSEAYSSYPVCSPFRAMLFSGIYPEDNGVWQNCAPGRTDELRADLPTLTDVLADGGYDVGYVGKWHLEEPRADFDECGSYIKEDSDYAGAHFFADGSPENAPTCWDTLIPKHRQRKIDYLYAYNTYDVFRYNEKTHTCKTPRLFDKNYVRHKPPYDTWSPDFETDIATDFIKNAGGVRDNSKPFALFVCYNPPHSPYNSREDTDREAYDTYYSSEDKSTRLPRRKNVTLCDKKFEENARVYFSHVTGIDRCVGRLRKALTESGLSDNTIIVYTSDHGDMMGSHGLMSKNVPYEESTAIPFIISYPPLLKHRIEPLFLTAVDIMPTLLGLVNVQKPSTLAGTDFSGLFISGKGERPYSALFTQQKRKGVRTMKYLFTVTYESDTKYGETVLYDMENDPYQLNNLKLKEIPNEDLQKLLSELGEQLKKSNDPWYKKRLYSNFIKYPD